MKDYPKNQHVELDDLITKAKCSILDLSFYIYIIIEKTENPSESFRYLCEKYYDSISSTEENTLVEQYSEEEEKKLVEQYGKLIDTMLLTVMKRNLPVDRFYQSLWEDIINLSLFTNDKEKAFALYYIWIDKRMPYFCLSEGKKMGNERYKEIIEGLSEEIKYMCFIINTPTLSQRTERASLILELLDGIEDKEKRIVLLSRLMAEIKQNKVPDFQKLFEC